MKKLIRLKDARAVQSPRLAASAAVVAAAVAGTAGIVSGQGHAAPAVKAGKASHLRTARFKRPKVKHGVLMIKGTNASDDISLRLEAGKPAVIQIDVGPADFDFERADVTRIAVDA